VRPSPHPNAWRIGNLTLAALALGLFELCYYVGVLAAGWFLLRLNPGQMRTLTLVLLVCPNAFMPEDALRRTGRHVAFEDVQIGAANRRPGDFERRSVRRSVALAGFREPSFPARDGRAFIPILRGERRYAGSGLSAKERWGE
jgi:hypothetical protein